MLPPVLSIAGSDNSAGAGIQADLKTFSAHGCYGLTAVTCVVAEVPGRVTAIQAVRTSVVEQQILLCLGAFPVRAIKTGMLYSEAIVNTVADALHCFGGPLVIDPVMVASSGDPLLRPSAIHAYWKRIFPLATLITPNLDELAFLSGLKIHDKKSMRMAGQKLHESTGCAVLLKGGHLKSRRALDILITADGSEDFEAACVPRVSTHGTGCTFSAAITSNLALGFPLTQSVAKAKSYITSAIRNSLKWKSTQALRHFPG